MSFHVGQRVVCVDDRYTTHSNRRELYSGNVYTIRRLDTVDGMPCVCLHEIPLRYSPSRGWIDYPFRATRFRPVKETDISIFTAMLAPTPKQKQRAATSEHQLGASEKETGVVP